MQTDGYIFLKRFIQMFKMSVVQVLTRWYHINLQNFLNIYRSILNDLKIIKKNSVWIRWYKKNIFWNFNQTFNNLIKITLNVWRKFFYIQSEPTKSIHLAFSFVSNWKQKWSNRTIFLGVYSKDLSFNLVLQSPSDGVTTLKFEWSCVHHVKEHKFVFLVILHDEIIFSYNVKIAMVPDTNLEEYTIDMFLTNNNLINMKWSIWKPSKNQ